MAAGPQLVMAVLFIVAEVKAALLSVSCELELNLTLAPP
jgi:hypothetical protein